MTVSPTENGYSRTNSSRGPGCASRLSALVCAPTGGLGMAYETLSETEWEAVDRVWDLLDQGETDQARKDVEALLRSRPGHPDLRIAEAAVALDEGDPERALQALEGAEQSADPSL